MHAWSVCGVQALHLRLLNDMFIKPESLAPYVVVMRHPPLNYHVPNPGRPVVMYKRTSPSWHRVVYNRVLPYTSRYTVKSHSHAPKAQ